jgi:hypothetical protein
VCLKRRDGVFINVSDIQFEAISFLFDMSNECRHRYIEIKIHRIRRQEGDMKKSVVLGVFLFLCFGIGTYAQNSVRANFGNYPADYGIAYFNTIGYINAPTVRGLFGPNAPFATTFQGVPCAVILESGSGDKNEFTAVLLLSLKNPKGEDIRIARLQVKFQPDNMTEKSYIRYFRFADLVSGQSNVQQSRGTTEREDAQVFGHLVAWLEYFWDTSKIKK